MHLPVIAFCTTCRGRAPHVRRTLSRNLADNARYPNAKFILLDYGSEDELIPYLKSDLSPHIASGRLVVYSYRDADKFRMAHAKNMAHRCGLLEGADILVNQDADNYTGLGFAEYIADWFAHAGLNTYLWAKMIKDGDGRLGRGISGRIVVTKHQFLTSGGYDEQYHTWSPDDKDFNARLGRLGYQGSEIDPKYLGVILHNDKMRFREYKHLRTNQDSATFDISESQATVVNFGKIGMGAVYRNFVDTPIELGTLPTRIFGIGLHKTATTSLHKALTILGYESAHWKNAHWAKAIWREMTMEGRSLTLERHYALSDLPIPLLYHELDRAYPGSKFILTVRNEDNWLRSVCNHWNPAYNQFRQAWNKDPFSHKAHKLLYGRRDFDAQVFLERYRQHNEDVVKHFEGRHADFRVMNMDAGADWGILCDLLGQPIPKVAYPCEFATPWDYGHGGLGI